MSVLSKRIETLESRAAAGLVLLLISRLPGAGRETASYEGSTYTQEPDETSEKFRARLAERLTRGKTQFLWVSEVDAAL